MSRVKKYTLSEKELAITEAMALLELYCAAEDACKDIDLMLRKERMSEPLRASLEKTYRDQVKLRLKLRPKIIVALNNRHVVQTDIAEFLGISQETISVSIARFHKAITHLDKEAEKL